GRPMPRLPFWRLNGAVASALVDGGDPRSTAVARTLGRSEVPPSKERGGAVGETAGATHAQARRDDALKMGRGPVSSAGPRVTGEEGTHPVLRRGFPFGSS